jgi:uncharacterized protein YndB with AHSA1/START domain
MTMITTLANAGPAPASAAPDNREAVATRVFDAPRALVWEACTNPEHVRKWYGTGCMEVVSCEIDLRVGGRFRYVLLGPDGNEYAFSGEYREVDPPSRVVNTWGFEAMPGHEAVETGTFEEDGEGRTIMRMSIVFQTPEDYAGWAGSGAFGGWAESLDRLAETVAALR